MSVAEALELASSNPGARFIDVRTPGEFAAVHIPGSYNIPLELLREHSDELRTHHDDPVVLVCASGARADQAQKAVQDAGFDELRVLDGGINDWARSGGPVNTGSGVWSMERQVRLSAGSIVLLSVLASLVFAPAVWLAAAVGAGFVFSAVTDTCGMAKVLAMLPHNRGGSCDPSALLRAMTDRVPGRS
ncbi:rhodanese-like domain-containing protein [Haloechinothrix sp. LS1_15]|nr:rhodanese-like domain-containing protein [Haloechinothrix sp. LS1_15]